MPGNYHVSYEEARTYLSHLVMALGIHARTCQPSILDMLYLTAVAESCRSQNRTVASAHPLLGLASPADTVSFRLNHTFLRTARPQLELLRRAGAQRGFTSF